MSTIQCRLNCGKCLCCEQRSASPTLKSWLCLVSRSPFSLRLMLAERLLGKKPGNACCPHLIWRG